MSKNRRFVLIHRINFCFNWMKIKNPLRMMTFLLLNMTWSSHSINYTITFTRQAHSMHINDKIKFNMTVIWLKQNIEIELFVSWISLIANYYSTHTHLLNKIERFFFLLIEKDECAVYDVRCTMCVLYTRYDRKIMHTATMNWNK